MYYLDEIERFRPLCEQEEADKAHMLKAAKRAPDELLKRESALMHMTASSMIINAARDRVLMAYHNIYGSWAWTGGHADGDGDLMRVALKEAREETGIKRVSPMLPSAVSLEILEVPRHYKRGKFVSAHLHLNLTYAFMGEDCDAIHAKPDENARVGWLRIDRLGEFVTERDMLEIYYKILSRMIHSQS